MRTLEMFEKPRAKPRVLMHVIDAGISHGACNAKGRGEQCVALFKCRKCGHESEWLECDNTTEVKKGIACPICNVVPDAKSTRQTKGTF